MLVGNEKEGGKVSGRIVDSDMNDVGRFLNRILGLSPGIQNRFCSLFDQYYSVFDGHHNSRTDGIAGCSSYLLESLIFLFAKHVLKGIWILVLLM